jgi:cation transport ATPase
MRARGQTAVAVVCEQTLAGVLGIADEVRSGAGEAVAAVADVTRARPVLLNGDNPGYGAPGRRDQVGINDVRAGLLPEDKVAAVRELATRQRPRHRGR